MDATEPIAIRPARRSDRRALGDFLAGVPEAGAAEVSDVFLRANVKNHVIAERGREILGACRMVPAAGRCAAVLTPRLLLWDDRLAARLIRAAAALAYTRDAARLIQVLTESAGGGPLGSAIAQAGFARLAVLAYLRRDVRPADGTAPLPSDIEWANYGLLRHRLFAETIVRTYEGSLDCPGLAGLRTMDETLATHKRTGVFSPRWWHVAMREGRPAGVVLLNHLEGRGEIAYLGVVPEARGRGVGRALVERAIQDAAEMGLPLVGLAVDTSNAPAVRLYAAAGFREIRRRLAWFIPKEGLIALEAER
jgi:ribosomal protein S18 acetylase RimI-like enzyme